MSQPNPTVKPNWEAVRELYEQGASDVEIARAMGITEAAFFQLMEDSPVFAKFVDRGRTLAKAWWYEKARQGIQADKFNTSLFNFVMKNRFGWADKIDTNDTTDKDPVNMDQLRGQLQATLKQVAKKHPELLSGVNLNQEKERT